MKPDTAALLERAADDEATLRLNGLPEMSFGQHSQAAIEKVLKALINEHDVVYPKIHDLERLVRKLIDLGETLPPLPVAIGDLTDYAMDFRYGESAQVPAPLDRKSCLEAVELIRTHVLARIQTLNSRPSTPSQHP